jgi:hypothetical protein
LQVFKRRIKDIFGADFENIAKRTNLLIKEISGCSKGINSKVAKMTNRKITNTTIKGQVAEAYCNR